MSDANTELGQLLTAQWRSVLAAAITDRHYRENPQLKAPYRPTLRDLYLQDTENHLRYLAEAIAAGRTALFADYIAWAKVRLASLGIAEEDLAHNLRVLREVLADELADEASAIAVAYIDQGLAQLPAMPSQLPTSLNVESELGDLGQRYLDLLLAGNRRGASQLVTEAVKDGAPIKTVYIEVFQNSQYEIGRLWQINEISIAQEHFCTAATQLIISQLYPYLFSHDKNGRRLVVACVGGDLHELGVRMVADFFEMEGWDTFYLGANTPSDSVVQSVIEHQPHVLGVSATMTYHVQTVADLIAQVRRTPECAEVKILVGGYPFGVDRELWRQIGADAMADDANDAIATANQLV